MRPIRALLIYFAVVFIGGALLAPWLYWSAHSLAAHSTVFAKLAGNPFHRFLGRALLGVAVLGLWPLLRVCDMLHGKDLGLNAQGRPLAGAAIGFLLGFGSLACVAALAVGCGGRIFHQGHSSADLLNRTISATLTAIIVAVLEEFLFRAALFGILRKATSWPAALVVSSAIYALAHFLQNTDLPGPVGWLSGLALLGKMFQSGPPLVPAVFTLFLAGSILALAYQRTGTLFLSMGLHAGWIFWLKTYGFFTATAPGANPSLWGTDRLIDGWLALPVLGVVLWVVSRVKPVGERPDAN